MDWEKVSLNKNGQPLDVPEGDIKKDIENALEDAATDALVARFPLLNTKTARTGVSSVMLGAYFICCTPDYKTGLQFVVLGLLGIFLRAALCKQAAK